jgi:hypothetical protein
VHSCEGVSLLNSRESHCYLLLAVLFPRPELRSEPRFEAETAFPVVVVSQFGRLQDVRPFPSRVPSDCDPRSGSGQIDLSKLSMQCHAAKYRDCAPLGCRSEAQLLFIYGSMGP